MRRKRKLLVVSLVVGLPVLVVTTVLLYLNFADLSGWRDTVAGLVSDSIGRELTIGGEFTPEIGFTTRLVASDITLANPSWSEDPHMVSVDRLVGEIDLLSLLFGPITIHDVEIAGARVLFELNADGHLNWEFESSGVSDGGGGEVELVLEHVLANDLQLAYRAPTRTDPLKAAIARLESTSDEKGMLDLDLVGRIGDTPVEISGRLGTFIGLINAATVEHDLTGELDGFRFASKGKIAELGTLDGVDLTADVHGDDLVAIRDLLDLPSELTGPFSLSAALSPTAAGAKVHLDATAAGITIKAAGTVDSLLKPQILDATVTASGPSIRTVGALTGVADLPDEEFSVSGGVRWAGFPITFRQIEITVGDNTLSADGVLGAPPLMMGTDFTLEGGGPDLSALAAIAGIRLPRTQYSVSGRIVRVEGGLEVSDATIQVGRSTATASGTVGDPPAYAGTDLRFQATGPSLAVFTDLAGTPLPAEPFEIDGRITEGQDAIILEGVRAHLGRSSLRVDGQLKTANGLSGTSLRIEAQGPDAAKMAGLAGISGVPAEAWTIDGVLGVLDSGYHLEGVSATLGSLTVHADGRVVAASDLVGTDLQLHVEDPDLSHSASIAGITGLPSLGFRLDGRIRVEGAGYRLDGVKVSAGDIDAEIAGLIGATKNLEGTQVHVKASGPRLDSLEPYLHQPGLPPAPFSVAGDLRVTGGTYVLDTVVAEVDRNRITLSGTVIPVEGLVGTDLRIDLAAPDLGQAGRLAAGFTTLPELPAEPLSLSTRLRIDEAGYDIDGLEARLGNAESTIDGRVGALPDLIGTDLAIESDGPNASLFSAVTGVTIPVAPFRVRGRFQRTDGGFHFDRCSVQLGDYRAYGNGSLGEPPRWVGTDLELRASGPSLALMRELTGLERLPDEVFRIAGRFKGTPELFTTEGLEIVVGDSDLKGSLEVDIRGKPAITARVSSNHLNLAPYLPHLQGREDEDADRAVASDTSTNEQVFSNKPINFGKLQKADADVDITIGTLQLPAKVFRDVTIGARLADGRLEVHRFAMVGQREGRGSGTLVLEPVGDNYRLDLVLDLDALRLDLPYEDTVDPASEPPINLDVRLEMLGSSPHTFAGSANGSVQVVIGKGVMDNQVLDLVTADVLFTLLNAFNPFAKMDETTEFQCGVFAVDIEHGLAMLEPMALQSDKMTMLGKGKIDLNTEKLDLQWVTKPRKGIGLSASMITNPYIKLGGTLSNPSVQLKGVEAVASTGVAVATLGLSLVAKGMLDRITAEKKVCKQALEEIGRRQDDTSKTSKKKNDR
jgi:uncharacterized protein involved in outer membrane biogenesis